MASLNPISSIATWPGGQYYVRYRSHYIQQLIATKPSFFLFIPTSLCSLVIRAHFGNKKSSILVASFSRYVLSP